MAPTCGSVIVIALRSAGWACTMICRTNIRSSAISPSSRCSRPSAPSRSRSSSWAASRARAGRLRPDRARPWIRCDWMETKAVRETLDGVDGASTARCGSPACMSRIARCSRALARRMAMPAGSPVPRPIPPGSRSRNGCGPPACPPITAAVGEQCLGARRGNSGCRGRGLALAPTSSTRPLRQAASSWRGAILRRAERRICAPASAGEAARLSDPVPADRKRTHECAPADLQDRPGHGQHAA